MASPSRRNLGDGPGAHGFHIGDADEQLQDGGEEADRAGRQNRKTSPGRRECRPRMGPSWWDTACTCMATPLAAIRFSSEERGGEWRT